ncbi:MAG: hypothetical protein HKN91_10680 [Acidimicrobiia bacterium]|nr:hypothetical protein [Acidimicrobiia bacterium]
MQTQSTDTHVVIDLREPTGQAQRAPLAPKSRVQLFTAVFIPLALIYLATATWNGSYNTDTLANALVASEIATDGDVFLEDYEDKTSRDHNRVIAWVVDSVSSATSQYPPGAALLAVPFYAVWPDNPTTDTRTVAGQEVDFLVPPIPPAAIATALAVAAAMAAMALALTEILTRRDAVLTAYALGLATGVWSIAADKLWLHTGAILYLAVGMWLASSRPLGSGLAYGMAVMTRPHTLVIGVATALGRAITDRSSRVLLRMGAGIGIGTVALLVFNYIVFGSLSVRGGYRLYLGAFVHRDNGDLLANVWGAFFDLGKGIFIFSPFLLMLLPGLRTAWAKAPAWARGSAIGGVVYFALQLYTNRFSGGSGFWGYRYPLEMLVALTPLLALAYFEWVKPRPVANRIFVALVAACVGLHAAGAIRCSLYMC